MLLQGRLLAIRKILTLILIAHVSLSEGNSGDDVYMKSNGITHMDNSNVDAVPKKLHVRVKRNARLPDNEKQILLDIHNAKRRLETSSDMEIMIWNDDLANIAQLWADVCKWEHGQPDNYANPPYPNLGQNLYVTTGTLNLQKAMDAWADEKVDYTYSTGACVPGKQCGHYTQIVWSTSREVGCAHSLCPTIQNLNFRNSKYLVCNYGPPGNYNGVKPFKIGDPCSECGTGYGWCTNKLCRRDCSAGKSECECKASCLNGGCPTNDCRCQCQDGYHGTTCKDACQNNHRYCGNRPGWPRGWCNSGRTYVDDACPLLCGSCKERSNNVIPCTYVPPTGYATPTMKPQSPSPSCIGYVCSNGGVALADDQNACSCYCSYEWMGATCEESTREATDGVIIHTSTDSQLWKLLEDELLPRIALLLENYCQINAGSCCRGETLPPGDRFSFADNVFVGTTYPNFGVFAGEKSTRVLVFAKSGSIQGNCKYDLPQDLLYAALYPERANLDTSIRTCCDSVLFDVVKAVVTPYRPLPTNVPTRITTDTPSMGDPGSSATSESPFTDSTTTTFDIDQLGPLIPIWLIVFLIVLIVGIKVSIGVTFILCRYRRNASKNQDETIQRQTAGQIENPAKKKETDLPPQKVKTATKKTVNFLPRSPMSILKKNTDGKKKHHSKNKDFPKPGTSVRDKIDAYNNTYYNKYYNSSNPRE